MKEEIIQGDCVEIMKTLPENSIDAVVTDPPYGFKFMGKKWDADVPSKEIWEECLRVLKPGGYLLSFAGTRTQHRMAVNIEDAGFEIRDMIAWVYGSGFPKSLNVGKAVDKLQGNDREVVGQRMVPDQRGGGINSERTDQVGVPTRMTTDTKGNSEWEGWGTALKPSHENITVAQKPFDSRSDWEYARDICRTLFVQIAKRSSTLNLDEKTQQGIAQWTAENNINTPEDLSEAMDMLQSFIKENTNLNIVWSWLNILEGIWKAQNTSTISTRLNTTIELKILLSLEWENIFQNIMPALKTPRKELSASVWNVESIFNALKLKLIYIQELFAEEPAISKGGKMDLLPNLEPITVARKPLEGTVAENVLKWGTGGMNIDGSRVATTDEMKETTYPAGREMAPGGGKRFTPEVKIIPNKQGRFPANLIHDGSDEVVGLFPSSKSTIDKRNHAGRVGTSSFAGDEQVDRVQRGDSGSAARFFYCAKASKEERNMGCEELEEKERIRQGLAGEHKNTFSKNSHPTVKPIALMEYLVKLVSKEGALVLDPFAGSGSTLIACKKLKRGFIGIEKEPEYVQIAQARLSAMRQEILV